MPQISENTKVGLSITTVVGVIWALLNFHNDAVSTAVEHANDDAERFWQQKITNMQIESTVEQIGYERDRTDRKYERLAEQVEQLNEMTRTHIEEFDERLDVLEHVSEHVDTETDGDL